MTQLHDEQGAAIAGSSPVWSPDGTSIVYQRGTRQDAHLFSIEAGGSNRTRLEPNEASSPAWQPCVEDTICYASYLSITKLRAKLGLVKDGVRVHGGLFPPHGRSSLTISVYKKRGRWHKLIETRRVPLGPAVDRGNGTFVSRYDARFDAPPGCLRVFVQFAQDRDHSGVSASRIIDCG